MENTFYDIFYCSICNTSQIDSSKYDPNIYEKIYNLSIKDGSIGGYDRYIKYSNEIKMSSNPLMYLAKKESTYLTIYNFLKDKKNLKILEVGCGLGYLSYSIKNLGHDVIGIDVSDEAINKAKELFGDYFICCDLLKNNNFMENSFDLIIGTELIEHLPNISDFVFKSASLLKLGGSLIFTTPNKSFFKTSYPDCFWITENPPVHMSWISEDSFTLLSKKHNLILEFLDTKYCYFENNHLIHWFYTKYIKSRVYPRWKNFDRNNSSRFDLYKISNKLISLPLVVFICNFIYYSIFGKRNFSIAVRLIKN